MNLPLLLVSALLAASVTPLALAEEIPPDVLVKSISEEVIAAVRHDKGIQAGDARKIAELVEARILPHFDFRHTTQIAMGINWRRATPEQQEQLTREFRALLVRTYSGALAGYSDQVIEFRPLRAQPGDIEVTVHSQVRRSGAEPIAIEYDLEKTGSAWKVFDIRVAGISLAATYRSAFAEEVRNHGIDGLISLLSSKNRGALKSVSLKT
ncbi:MAG: ABC transporter substrate-binding protein [Betaproteobacteria bacterium]|nr:MAG: ABC transporter substrate-binding protein [Betaproteobacteria bacterium]